MTSTEHIPSQKIAQSAHTSPTAPKKRPINGISSADHALETGQGDHSQQNNANGFTDFSRIDPPETGRRKRKKTRAFEVAGPTFVRRFSTGAKGVSGLGVKLSAIPNIAYALDKRNAKSPEVEYLHRLLFNSAGTVLKRKTNIRKFSGFVFKSEKERGRVRDKLLRSHLNILRRLAALLDITVTEKRQAKQNRKLTPMKDAKIELAAEAFLGLDSPSQERQNGTDPSSAMKHGAESTTAGISRHSGDSSTGEHAGERKGADVSTVPSSSSGKAGSDDAELTNASNDDSERAKLERQEAKQKRDEAARITKEDTAKAILQFLELPQVAEGRVNLAQREKEKKRLKKAQEKEKAQKEMQRKAEEKKKQLLKRGRESDEDGDEDLETDAKCWIQLAREKKASNVRKGSGKRADGGG